MLITGDSIVRNVRVNRAHTLFFPSATVQDIDDEVPDIIKSYPEVDKIVIHVSTNDIQKQQCQLLKQDFANIWTIKSVPNKKQNLGAS